VALTLFNNNGANQVDINSTGICDIKLTVSYQHPAALSFTVLTPQNSLPFTMNDGVTFFDDSFSTTLPVFLGHVRQITPGQNANEVKIVCHDPGARVAEEIYITNGIEPNNTTIPRVVYNVTIDHDEDKGYEQLTYTPSSTPYGFVAVYATVAQIITDLFANQQALLYSLWAGPADGVTSSIVQSDLGVMDYQPQEKIVYDSENLISGVQRLTHLYPAKRVFFDASTRQFRVHQPIDSTDVTLVLNQAYVSGAPVPNPVLSMQLDRVLDRRYTAFKLVGKPQTAYADLSQSTGGIVPQNVPGDSLNHPPGSFRQWQVVDPTKRHLARFITPGQWAAVAIPQGNAGVLLTFFFFEQPALLVTYDTGQTWQVVNQMQINVARGLVQTPYFLYQLQGQPPNQTIKLPDDVRFLFNYYTPSIVLRYPSSGFQGNAYSTFGIQAERKVYHELLNTGFLKWDTTTQQEKITQYTKLAQQALRAYQDAVYTGGCTIFGVDYQYLRLNRRINFTAVDQNNNPLTTGWEQAHAILTDVEYDYSDAGKTTLTFSGDLSGFVQTDVEQLRKVLKIKARAIYRQFFFYFSRWTEGPGGMNMNKFAGFQTVKVGEEG
jgi:hypothetical protein